jgi:hypothetical protein
VEVPQRGHSTIGGGDLGSVARGAGAEAARKPSSHSAARLSSSSGCAVTEEAIDASWLSLSPSITLRSEASEVAGEGPGWISKGAAEADRVARCCGVGGGIGDFDERLGTGGGPIAPGPAAARTFSAAFAPASAAMASTGGRGADSTTTGCSEFLPVLRFFTIGSGAVEEKTAAGSSLSDLPRAAARTTALPLMAEDLGGLELGEGAITGVLEGGSFLFRCAREGVIGGGGGSDGFTGLAREDLRKPVVSDAVAGDAEVAGEDNEEEMVDWLRPIGGASGRSMSPIGAMAVEGRIDEKRGEASEGLWE